MKMKTFKKKGVSPLVATVLLISFTVAIIVLVIIWGRNYIEEKAQKEGTLAELGSECMNVDFGFVEACRKGTPEVLSITLKNKKPRAIDAFVFQFKEGGSIDPVDVLQKLPGDEQKTFEVAPKEPGFFPADSVNMIPRLKAGAGVYVPCSSKALEIKADTSSLGECPEPA